MDPSSDGAANDVPGRARIRPAAHGDVPAIVDLVHDLARYERASEEVRLRADALEDALFGRPPQAGCLVAEHERAVVGFALYFFSFSTWTGRQGIWLEDLYVRPEQRGHGVGTALVAALADLAIQSGRERLEWSVLDWNRPAWDFYAGLGATAMSEWTTHRLSGQALRALGTRNAADPVPWD